jgi:hypothetical protein
MRTPASNTTDFFVNGAKVSADQARALQGKDIGSIEVVKSELPSGRDTIFVTTADRMPKEFKSALRSHQVEEGGAGQEIVNARTVRDSTEHMVSHVERELAGMRTRTAGESAPSEEPQATRLRTSSSDAQPVFLIDGRKATMTEVAALPESEIRSVRVHKKDGTGIDPDAENGMISIETRARQKQ